MKLAYTRAMVTAALTGEIEKAAFVTDPTFGVQVPTSIEGVPSELLIPANTWEDKAAYEASCREAGGQLRGELQEVHPHERRGLWPQAPRRKRMYPVPGRAAARPGFLQSSSDRRNYVRIAYSGGQHRL